MTTTATTAARTTWRRALAWRARRHLLDPRGHGVTASDVVRRLTAVPATDSALAELAVGARRTEPEQGALARAVATGEVVTVFAFRGATFHLHPRDGAAYLALRAAGRQWERASWVEHYRLSPQQWPALRSAVREALDDGPLTVVELGRAVARHSAFRHLLPFVEDGAGTLLKPLSWQGDVGFGPTRDGRATFQRLDRAPGWQGPPDLDEAGRWAVTAYLASYGPATPANLHHWLGEGLSAGTRRLAGWWEDLADRRVALDVEGTTAYVLAEHVDELLATEPDGAVRLLPGHDQWVMAPGTEDEHVVPAALREAVTRKAGLVLQDGVVGGTWVIRQGTLTVTWAGRGPVPQPQLRDETARVAATLGVDLSLAT